jgi:hypothetical protein
MNGHSAVGTIDGDGEFVQTGHSDAEGMAGWTHVCRLESTLFFYDTNRGSGA